MQHAPKKRGRPATQTRQLNQALIIYMAKTLMREQNNMPSIRMLAASLEVDAMAIYHYFKNKNALLEAITGSLMDGLYHPKKQQTWQVALLHLCESYLSLMVNYSDLLGTLITMQEKGLEREFNERFNKVVSPLALPAGQQKSALLLLLNFLHGHALSLKETTLKERVSAEFDGMFALYCQALSVK